MIGTRSTPSTAKWLRFLYLALVPLAIRLAASAPLAQSPAPAPSADAPAPVPDPLSPEATRTEVGKPAPAFKVMTLKGESVDTASLKGKVTVVNFWATWCAPCKMELPRLEKEVWQAFRSSRFALVAIARQQTEADIRGDALAQKLTMPLAADPDASIYHRFADGGIPRTYVLGGDGKILYQSVGYDPAEFVRMTRVVRNALARPAAGQ
jgi:peroxiredoxin